MLLQAGVWGNIFVKFVGVAGGDKNSYPFPF